MASSLFGGFSCGEKLGIGILTKKEFKKQERSSSHNRVAKSPVGPLKMHPGPFQCGGVAGGADPLRDQLGGRLSSHRIASWARWEPAFPGLWPCVRGRGALALELPARSPEPEAAEHLVLPRPGRKGR